MYSWEVGARAKEGWSRELEKELRVWVSLPVVSATRLNPRFKAYSWRQAIFRSPNLPSINITLLQVCWSQGVSAESIIWSAATPGQNSRRVQPFSAEKCHPPHTHLPGKNPMCGCVHFRVRLHMCISEHVCVMVCIKVGEFISVCLMRKCVWICGGVCQYVCGWVSKWLYQWVGTYMCFCVPVCAFELHEWEYRYESVWVCTWVSFWMSVDVSACVSVFLCVWWSLCSCFSGRRGGRRQNPSGQIAWPCPELIEKRAWS